MSYKKPPSTEKIYYREQRQFDVSRIRVGNPSQFDLSNHVYLKTHETVSGNLEEWVHREDYDHYIKTERSKK